jgi:hypothetical protein
MRTFQLLTLIATMLTLPSYGMAGLAHRSCQEEMDGAKHMMMAGDCCPGKADQSTHCKQSGDGPLGKNGSCSACKAGYNCKSPQTFELTDGAVIFILPARPASSADAPALLLSHGPDGLWRPPR